jgi:diphthamide biosynthesis methyltransferase
VLRQIAPDAQQKVVLLLPQGTALVAIVRSGLKHVASVTAANVKIIAAD